MEEKLLPLKRSEPLIDEDGETVRIMTEKPPVHCILKIDSFSVFKDATIYKSNEDNFKSIAFYTGGYTWVLSVCPKGNKQEQIDDHLSVYVTLIDKLNPGSYVDVVLRFFLYDHLRDAYLSVLDVREKRFHALKDTWGIPKFLPISTFNDPDYGFLVDDHCVFGAEVLVIKDQAKISSMSIVNNNCVRSYTWEAINSSFASASTSMYSSVFWLNGWSWRLELLPKGSQNMNGEFLSLYLHLYDYSKLTKGNKLYVEYFLKFKNQQIKGENHQKLCYNWFYSGNSKCGSSDFISVSDLLDSSKGYLVFSTIIIEVCVEKMFLLKDY